MSKILVTGGAGFIGSYVVDLLVADGHTVVVFARSSTHDDPRPQVRTFLGDIRDQTSVFEAIAHCDAFIHLAGVLGTQETLQNPLPAIDTNIQGGINILEAAARYDVPGVNIAVGNHWENNPYSITKSTVERFVRMYNAYRGTHVSIVRAMNAYGPRQSVASHNSSKVRKIMPSFIHMALNGDPIEVYGTGAQVMDMVYVTDVADVLVAALYQTVAEHARHMKSDEVFSAPMFEVGSGVSTSVLDIAKAVRLSVDSDVRIVNLPMRVGETGGVPAIADRGTLYPLYGEYGKGFVSLKDGVSKTVEYYRSCL